MGTGLHGKIYTDALWSRLNGISSALDARKALSQIRVELLNDVFPY